MRSFWLCALLLLTALPALARAEEGDDDDSAEDAIDPDVDDPGIYQDFKADVQGNGPGEELDAWDRYLEAYPKSLFRLEIEQRMGALRDAADDELLKEDRDEDRERAARADAKRSEIDVPQSALMGVNPNPKRRVSAELLWGYSNVINYDLNFEWAFLRKFSAWGGIRHVGAGGGDLGLTLQVGAKYALIKDVRTGVVLTGYLALEPGYSQADNFLFTVTPGIGFALARSPRFQLSTTLQMDLQLNKFRTVVWWDIQAVINPNKVLGIYLESKQKHGLFTTSLSSETQYLAFFQAGVGVKIHPNEWMELTFGANIPYFWRIWKDYQYLGVHGGVVFNLPGKPKK